MNEEEHNKNNSILTVSKLSLGKNSERPGFHHNVSSVISTKKNLHNRNPVIVEVKKKRVFTKDEDVESNIFTKPLSTEKVEPPEQHSSFRNKLTSSEHSVRLKALQEAAQNEVTDKQKYKESDLEPEDVETLSVEEIENKEVQKQNINPIDENKTTSNNVEDLEKTLVKPIKNQDKELYVADEESDEKQFKKPVKHDVKTRGKFDKPRRSSGKINVNTLAEEEEEKTRSLAALKRAREKARRLEENYTSSKDQEKMAREVIIPEVITVQELSGRMYERSVDVIKELMKLGMLATVNQTIDADTAELLVTSFGHKPKRVSDSDVENILFQQLNTEDALISRPPVVTIMGHVDHGKTSLLDALRSTDVALGEAGGITQHIGAYQIELVNGKRITFIDTPGHEAFTAMRARGAKVTDIVILVVAADDGIKAQTIEAINHAKAANVPIIVAVNKIDKPDSNPEKVKNELLSHDLVPEEFGGEVMVVNVSAKNKINLDKLEDAILFQAELLNLKANPNRAALGTVVEARIDKGCGVVTTVLIQQGTLKLGHIVVAGNAVGKVRAILDYKGKSLKEALPSMPVEIQGLNVAPDAGDHFAVVETEKQARDIAEYRGRKTKTLKIASQSRMSLQDLFSVSSTDKNKELSLIIKGDVQGSVEAIIGSIIKIPTDEIRIKILHSGVGAINESDITLSNASKALILAFNVRQNATAKELAQKHSVEVRYYSIIYDLVNEVKAIVSGMLSPIIKEEEIGKVEIRKVFNVSKFGKIAGCYVTEGIIKRGAGVRLLRDNIVIFQGKLKTLRRFKDDVKEAQKGFECGIALENYDDIREGDVIEAYEIIEERKTIE